MTYYPFQINQIGKDCLPMLYFPHGIALANHSQLGFVITEYTSRVLTYSLLWSRSWFVLILYYHTPYLFLLCSWGCIGGLGGSSVLYITTRNYLRKTLDLAGLLLRKGVGTRKLVNLTVRSLQSLSEVFVSWSAVYTCSALLRVPYFK